MISDRFTTTARTEPTEQKELLCNKCCWLLSSLGIRMEMSHGATGVAWGPSETLWLRSWGSLSDLASQVAAWKALPGCACGGAPPPLGGPPGECTSSPGPLGLPWAQLLESCRLQPWGDQLPRYPLLLFQLGEAAE